MLRSMVRDGCLCHGGCREVSFVDGPLLTMLLFGLHGDERMEMSGVVNVCLAPSVRAAMYVYLQFELKFYLVLTDTNLLHHRCHLAKDIHLQQHPLDCVHVCIILSARILCACVFLTITLTHFPAII